MLQNAPFWAWIFAIELRFLPPLLHARDPTVTFMANFTDLFRWSFHKILLLLFIYFNRINSRKQMYPIHDMTNIYRKYSIKIAWI